MVPECRPNNPFPANSTGNPNWKQAKEKAGGSESRLNSKKDTICGADRLADLICNAMSRSEPIKTCVTLPAERNQQRQMLVQQLRGECCCLTFPFPCTYICVCYKSYANTTLPRKSYVCSIKAEEGKSPYNININCNCGEQNSCGSLNYRAAPF